MNRWLVAAVVVLLGALVGLGVWLKTETDNLAETELALAETETALGETEDSLAAMEQKATEFEDEITSLQTDLDALESNYNAKEDEVANLESAVASFLAVAMGIAQDAPVDAAEAECLSETLVETEGAAEILVLFAEAAQDPSAISPVFTAGLALVEAAESCGLPLEEIFGGVGVDVELVATQLDSTGYFVDPDTGVSEQVVAEAVAVARASGGVLYIAVLSYEPDEGTIAFSDAVLGELGTGYVFTIGAETVGYSGDGSFWSQSEMNSAVDASLQGFTDEEIIRLFVDSLTGSSN